jgi:DNA-binding PadR family transcriptional regulator
VTRSNRDLDIEQGDSMRNDNPWAAEFEAVRRHRSRGRGHSRHPGGPGWGGPMGPPPWVAQMFGPQWAGHGGGRGRGRPRVRRGDVRGAIIDVLGASAEPLNGYQVIQQIAERTNGVWKPSPGSVYPTISWLQDEGFVEDAATGRKTLQLTDIGRQYVADHAEELAAIWRSFDADDTDDADGSDDLRRVIGQTVGAIVQVASTGTSDQRAKAVQILADTRRRLYGLLAEGPEADGESGPDTEE